MMKRETGEDMSEANKSIVVGSHIRSTWKRSGEENSSQEGLYDTQEKIGRMEYELSMVIEQKKRVTGELEDNVSRLNRCEEI